MNSGAQSVEEDTAAVQAAEPGSSPGARSSYQLGQSLLVRSRIELIGLRQSGRGVLYIYEAESFSQFFGELEALREYARQRYPEAEFHETLLDGFFEVSEKL